MHGFKVWLQVFLNNISKFEGVKMETGKSTEFQVVQEFWIK
jgi:hypothetical protein